VAARRPQQRSAVGRRRSWRADRARTRGTRSGRSVPSSSPFATAGDPLLPTREPSCPTRNYLHGDALLRDTAPRSTDVTEPGPHLVAEPFGTPGARPLVLAHSLDTDVGHRGPQSGGRLDLDRVRGPPTRRRRCRFRAGRSRPSTRWFRARDRDRRRRPRATPPVTGMIVRFSTRTVRRRVNASEHESVHKALPPRPEPRHDGEHPEARLTRRNLPRRNREPTDDHICGTEELTGSQRCRVPFRPAFRRSARMGLGRAGARSGCPAPTLLPACSPNRQTACR
jgi:hypothetical protein